MKRVLLASAAAFIFASGVFFVNAGADEKTRKGMHEMMHEMMSKGKTGPDERIELKLSAPMKAMQKNMMREHLSTIGEITAALAANDLAKASLIAREKLGFNPDEEEMCNTVADVAGEKDFASLGIAVHKKADEVSEAAKAGDRDKALEKLSQLINNCNACHERFRL